MNRDEIVLLDLRPEIEFQAGHLPGAVSMPLDELAAQFQALM